MVSITPIKRLTWASEGSRWYGVGSTLSSGSATSSNGFPPNGSLYAASTAPPSASTRSVRRSSSAPCAVFVSAAVSPTEPAAFLRRIGFLRDGMPAMI